MTPNELRDVPLEFVTDRLIIRAPMPGIGAELFESIQASLTELRPWLPWVHDPNLSPESVEAEARRAHARFLTRDDLRFHMFLRENGRLIGGTGLHRINWSVPKFEIGYWVDSRHTGKGYAYETSKGLTDFAFDRLKARRVEIRCDSLNARSKAIPERLGFEFEGELCNFMAAFDDPTQIRNMLVYAKTK